MIEKADILWQDSDIDARIRLQKALFPDGLMYDSEKGFLNPPMSKAFNLLKVLNASESDLVAGTVCAPDWCTIPTVSVHWIYKGVKQGAKKLERLGIKV